MNWIVQYATEDQGICYENGTTHLTGDPLEATEFPSFEEAAARVLVLRKEYPCKITQIRFMVN